uniref:PLAT domain-containing protein n=3 Tax=Clytia hemisphaerica TaxID=252671 RepID=A0A7M5VDM8_9CNID
MDTLGGVTVALKSEVIVKVQPSSNPPQIIQQNVIHKLDTAIEKKEKVKALSLIIGSAIFLSYGDPKNNISISLVNKLTIQSSEIKPSILQDVRMIVSASFLLRQAIEMSDLEIGTRKKMLDSMKESISFSDILAKIDSALPERAHQRLFYLLKDNFDFDTYFTNLQNTENVVNPNYETIQNVYELVLRNLVNDEDRIFKSHSIAADIQKINTAYERYLEQNVFVGECKFDYQIMSKQQMANEIRECSRHNPYARTDSNSSIASLTFKDDSLNEVAIKDLSRNESVKLSIPTTPETAEPRNVFTLKKNELAYINIRKALAHIYSGDLNTALTVSVNVTQGVQNDGLLYIHRSEMIEPQKKNMTTVVFKQKFNEQANRTLVITGSDFSNYENFYFGVHHDSASEIEVEFNFVITKCHFWNVTSLKWDGTGCRVANMSSNDVITGDVICLCNHLTSFGAGLRVVPNELDFTVLREIDFEENPIALVTILVALALYLILLFMARRKDNQESQKDHVITFIGSEESFYHYEIRIKTGMYPYSGTSSRVGIQMFGTSCVTKTRVLKTPQSFQRNSLDIFRISLDQSIGKLHKIEIWHDYSGNATEWFLERVVIKNLVDGEKFFFFCNEWIGPRHDNGNAVHKFHVADKHELNKFSVIFYDMIGRCLNDLHMWFSLFERPKYSRFNRKQRLSCLFTFLFTWMAVNAMWFDDGQQTYINSSSYSYQIKGFSLQEIIIGLITVLMVFPLNFLFWLLFRKSRQKEIPNKLLKVWKKPRRVHTDFINIMDATYRDNSDDDENLETQSLIRRKKKCRDIHDLLEDSLNAEDVGVDTCNLSLSSTTTSSKTPLLLPRTFGGLSGQNEEGMEESTYEFFEKWKVENFGSTQLPMTPSKSSYSKHESEKHSVSCCTLRGETIPKIRRTHSAGGSSVDLLEDARFTNIRERVHSAHYSTIGQEDFTVFHFNKHAQQIQRNEQLAKELAIPDIMEYDPIVYWTLPHWCVYIGYLCCFSLSTFCIIVVLTYGQQFGREKALKWLKSLLFGFVEDIFFVYPLLMILVSAVTALFIKPLDLDVIDHLDFKICASSPAQKSLTNVYPPNTDILPVIAKSSRAQHKRRKRTHDLVLQILMTWLALIAATNNDVIFNVYNESFHQQLQSFGGEYLSSGT